MPTQKCEQQSRAPGRMLLSSVLGDEGEETEASARTRCGKKMLSNPGTS